MFEEAGENFTVAKRYLDAYCKRLSEDDSNGTKGNLATENSTFVEEFIAEYEKTQPVRKIRASRRSVTGWINGYAFHDPVPFESTIERDCVQQLLFDQRIEHVQSQPLTIAFPKESSSNRSYTPDYLATYRRGNKSSKILIECKPQDEWVKKREKLTSRYRYVTSWANERGMDFVLLTDQHVRGKSLENVKALAPHLYTGPPEVDGYSQFRPQITELLPATNIDVLDAVEKLFPSRADAQTEILAMIANQKIFCDLDAPLDMDTVLHRPREGWEPHFLFDKGIFFGD